MQQLGIFLPGVYSELLPSPANDTANESIAVVTSRQSAWPRSMDEWPLDASSLKALVAEVTRRFETEIGVLRKALQFYADRSHIKVGDFGIAVEDGKRAQEALKGVAH